MRPPRKPTGPNRPPFGSGRPGPGRPTSGRPTSGRPTSDRPDDRRSSGARPGAPARRDGDAPPDRARSDRPSSDRARSGPARADRRRDERPTGDRRADRGERPERGDRRERPAPTDRPRGTDRAPARPNTRPIRSGAGKPAPSTDRSDAPRAKRTAPPVRQTEVAPQRIAKALARAGVGSRRDIERMIGEGRIAIAGEVLTSPALNITSLAQVTVDGEPVAGIAPAKLYRFHKPAGFLTAARDPAGRPTIMDILPAGLPRVVPVGRLDMNTEGLLLLTTDGELKRALELPSSNVPRVYRVRAFGEVSQKALESLADGISIDGIHYGPVLADIERKTGHNLWLIVTIREGKNREVRRILEHVGLQVNRLIRVAYGPIGLDDLPPRMADEIPESDLAQLKAMLKAPKPERR